MVVGFVLIVCSSACGDNSSAPSAAVQNPGFPNVMGLWLGTDALIVTDVLTGAQRSSNCSTTWFVENQSGGSMSGTYQLSGGTPFDSCADRGTLSGSVTTAGALIARFLSASVDVSSRICASVSGGALTGVVNAETMRLQGMERFSCITGSLNDQTRTLALTSVKERIRAERAARPSFVESLKHGRWAEASNNVEGRCELRACA